MRVLARASGSKGVSTAPPAPVSAPLEPHYVKRNRLESTHDKYRYRAQPAQLARPRTPQTRAVPRLPREQSWIASETHMRFPVVSRTPPG